MTKSKNPAQAGSIAGAHQDLAAMSEEDRRALKDKKGKPNMRGFLAKDLPIAYSAC